MSRQCPQPRARRTTPGRRSQAVGVRKRIAVHFWRQEADCGPLLRSLTPLTGKHGATRSPMLCGQERSGSGAVELSAIAGAAKFCRSRGVGVNWAWSRFHVARPVPGCTGGREASAEVAQRAGWAAAMGRWGRPAERRPGAGAATEPRRTEPGTIKALTSDIRSSLMSDIQSSVTSEQAERARLRNVPVWAHGV
jgi:hypothetical protein